MKPKGRGFTKVPNVIAQQSCLLNPYQFRIYTYLKSFNPCFPSLNSITRVTRISRKQAVKVIGQLERFGLVAVDRTRVEGRSNRYTVFEEEQWTPKTRALLAAGVDQFPGETDESFFNDYTLGADGYSNKTNNKNNLIKGYQSVEHGRQQVIPGLSGDQDCERVLRNVPQSVQEGWLNEFGDTSWLQFTIGEFGRRHSVEELRNLDLGNLVKRHLSEKWREFGPNPGSLARLDVGELIKCVAKNGDKDL